MKKMTDYCEYDFECASRCCTNSLCSPPNSCHLICKSNLDCVMMESCCSEGHCTQDLVCKGGNKIIGDYCDKSSECNTKYCDLTKNTCGMIPSPKDVTKLYISMLLHILLYIIVIAFVLTSVYFGWYFRTEQDAYSRYPSSKSKKRSQSIQSTNESSSSEVKNPLRNTIMKSLSKRFIKDKKIEKDVDYFYEGN